MRRPCWTQRCYDNTFIDLKRALKRVLLDPWKDHAGPKGVMKRLFLDSNVPWRYFCLTHEKTMLGTNMLWKNFYWNQTCYKKSFAWPMKRPCCPKNVMKRLLLDSNVPWGDFCLTLEKIMLDTNMLRKNFFWDQACYKKSFAWPMKRQCWNQRCHEKTFIGLKLAMGFAWPMKRPCWTQICYEKTFIEIKRAIKRVLLDPWKDHAVPKTLWKDFYWTQTCHEQTFAWPMKRPCWTQKCYEKTFIEIKRAIKRVLLDPWKDHAGPKGVMKRLLLDSNVLWVLLDPWKDHAVPKTLWKDFYWTQTCHEEKFAWPMKRPCWTQICYEKTFIEIKRATKRVLLDPWEDHAGPKGVMKRLLLDSNVL